MLRSLDYKKIVAIAFVFGVFMDILDTTIINVAVPSLARHFEVGTSRIEWVVTGYLLSLAVWIPASGWIGDKFGTKRTFVFALFMFTLASALCGAAWSVNSLIGFRVLQGVGGGMLTPVGTAMLFRAYPPDERARASAVLAIPTVLAPALGPVLGGVLVTHFSWRWIFYVNVPIGVLGLIFSVLYLEEHKEPRSGRFDIPGFVLSGAGLALVLYALAEGTVEGVDVERGAAHRARRARGLRVAGALRAAHPRAHARPAPLRRPHVPPGQHRHDGPHRQPARPAVPPAVLPAEPAGAERAAVRARHVPAGARGDDDGPRGRAALPQGRAPTAHDVRRAGQRHGDARVRVRGPGHQPVVGAAHHVRTRPHHGLRHGADAGRVVRDDPPGEDGAGVVVAEHQPAGGRGHSVWPRWPRS